ncbi:ATP-binding cassette domain-containing protein [bacterium 3DAC]|nr:ATP-binding cassette domain-containing protein [bacterium 3DAC]
MKRLFDYLKSQWKKILIAFIALILVDIMQILYPQYVRKAINLIKSLSTDTDKSYWISVLWHYAFIMIALYLAVAIFRLVYRWFLRTVAVSYDHQLRMAIMDKYLSFSERDLQKFDIGDLMSRLIRDTRSVRRFIMMGTIILVDLVVLGGMTIVTMVSMSPYLTLVSVPPMIILTLFVLWAGSYMQKKFKVMLELFGEMTERVRETAVGIKVIKTFVREDFFMKLFEQINDRYIGTGVKLFTLQSSFWPLSSVVVGLSLVIVLWVGGDMVMSGKMDIGTLVSFMMYINMIAWPMLSVGMFITVYSMSKSAIQRIDEVLTYEPEVKDTGTREIEGVSNITVKDIKDDIVLKGVSFSVSKGQVLGITGPPGSGKTVLMKYLPRLWQPGDDMVFVNDIDVNDIRLASLRRHFSYVPQDPILFAGTVRDNIAFAKPDATEEEIIWAAKMACVWDDIQALPKGLDTVVGERGITLSGGQRQRVSIARAFLAGKDILILDDPLSAVDTHTERCIIKNLKEYVAQHSPLTIIVSHRIPAIHWADYVLVLEGGKVLEEGTPEELAERDGLYSRLYRYQMGGDVE